MGSNFLQALFDINVKLPNDSDFYIRLLKDADFLSVASQVYFLLKEQERLEQTPLYFQVRLKEMYTKVLYQNIFIKNQNELILNQFEMAEIDVIPLKGVLFSEKYFGGIGGRATSDIDLLIKPNEVCRAMDVVKALGFTVEEEPIAGHFHCSLSKELPHSKIPLTVELHWDLLRESTANFKIEEFWNAATPMDQSIHVMELSHYHTFYMICLHGWRHNLDSIKYYLDIIQLLYSINDEIDFTVLLMDAKRHQTSKRVIRTLSILYQEYPFLKDVIDFPNIRKIRFRQPMKFGESKTKTFAQYLDFIGYQFLSYDNPKHSFNEILSWGIPKETELRNQLDQTPRHNSTILKYIYLYKKRISSLFKSLSLRRF